ncbi:hypothetical protein [Leptospira ilyithenensis]|uniref:Outer membrane protein beta-barrel domain-containing protein n=1 Tax=Leptospira ilyithenensis TaxID=2484901 RepID=A0A4R9LM37_9LEPT|nr:hypothetical protein [Leptospira ilyithenensis]TGN07060.1 hypothetical protein EHS11_18235 [Leptospira ilyithenensis]
MKQPNINIQHNRCMRNLLFHLVFYPVLFFCFGGSVYADENTIFETQKQRRLEKRTSVYMDFYFAPNDYFGKLGREIHVPNISVTYNLNESFTVGASFNYFNYQKTAYGSATYNHENIQSYRSGKEGGFFKLFLNYYILSSPLYLNFGMATMPDFKFTSTNTLYNQLTREYESYSSHYANKTPLVLDLGLGLKFIFFENFLTGFEMGAYRSFSESTRRSIEPNIYFPSSYTPNVATPFLANSLFESGSRASKDTSTSGVYLKILFGIVF